MHTRKSEIKIIGLSKLPEIKVKDDLAQIITDSANEQGLQLLPGDILVIAQKIVSKSEGRIIDLREIVPSPLALNVASRLEKDARFVEVVLRESKNIIKIGNGILIVETHHGFICANAGVDKSNVAGHNAVTLLPEHPDSSAKAIRERIKSYASVDVSVIISDTFGRPWREGLVNIAIGVSGLAPLIDYRGQKDNFGRALKASVIALADELASAAELVMGKVSHIPVVIVRGYAYDQDEQANSSSLIRDPQTDLFR